ncbi:hypothetical protein CRM22_006684 [Opisthorchis felineus]|uniref:Phosphatidylinositol N-acetylglucosaminyltransferase subunit H conserved domain-containing protein n=1 Tax=Opisthorchis felineus TaxID=147828 RepID=A0A4S2LJP9_OPIFE|nr:hypothetical protein CRM22_006684 [Opisthorchis felineus]
MDGLSLVFQLSCGCECSVRAPLRADLVAGLCQDPLSPLEHVADNIMWSQHPGWIEIKLRRTPNPSYWIAAFLMCIFVSFLFGCFFESFLLQFMILMVLLFGLLVRLRNTIVEESLLVASNFGIQTRHRFLTGRQSSSAFIPLDRLRGLLLAERTTPTTVISYLAAELSAVSSTALSGNVDNDSLSHQLLPLLPSCLTSDEQNFAGRLCLPLPALVFILRLAHSVCYPPTM